MSVTIELPLPINKELNREAENEGISAEEHAALLLCLGNALVPDDTPSPFKNAVRSFLGNHQIDTARVATVLEALIAACLHDVGKSSTPFQDGVEVSSHNLLLAPLQAWRSPTVHSAASGSHTNSGDSSEGLSTTPSPTIEHCRMEAANGSKPEGRGEVARVNAINAGRGSMAYLGISVADLQRERQVDREREEASIKGMKP